MKPRWASAVEVASRGRRTDDAEEEESLDGLTEFEEDDEFDDEDLDDDEDADDAEDDDDEESYDDFDEDFDDDGEPKRGGGGRPRREWGE